MLTEKNGLYTCVSVPRLYKDTFAKDIMYYVEFIEDEVMVYTKDKFVVMKKKLFFDHFSRVKSRRIKYE